MMMQHTELVKRVAPTSSLHLVAVATEKLMSRVDGLPGIGVMYGPPGRGKTVACTALANNTRGYYVQVRSAWSRKNLLEKILIEMGMRPTGTISHMLDFVCEQLGASGRPLLLDEFDHCCRTASMIELVRDIYEGSQGTLLLVGEENIPTVLKRHERFHSRVMAWIPALPVSLDDVRLLAPIYAPDVEIEDTLLQHIVELANGSVRRASVNLTRVHDQAMTLGEPVMSMQLMKGCDLYVGEAPARRK